MMIYIFWKLKEFTNSLPYFIDVPFTYLEEQLLYTDDLDEVILEYIQKLGYNVPVVQWGPFDELKNEIVKVADNRKTVLDIMEKVLDDNMSVYMRLEIISKAIDILKKERRAFVGSEGILYLVENKRSNHAQTAKIIEG
jgi:hypothetical protein